jgi:hypothetical protein
MMKFSTDNGTGVLKGDQESTCLCYNTILKELRLDNNIVLKEPRLEETLTITTDFRDEWALKQGEPFKELVEVIIEDPDRKIMIRSQLAEEILEMRF